MKSMKIFFLTVLSLIGLGNALEAQVLKYGTGTWNVDSLGNHRAVVKVAARSNALLAHIDWRRRDHHPEKIDVVIVDATTGKQVKNAVRLTINREFGEFIFQAPSAGVYYFYYMPHVMSKGNYPKVYYNEPKNLADRSWVEKNKLSKLPLPASQLAKFQKVTAKEIQSIDAFNSFYPMEVIASAAEINK